MVNFFIYLFIATAFRKKQKTKQNRNLYSEKKSQGTYKTLIDSWCVYLLYKMS